MPRRPGKVNPTGTVLLVNDEPDFSFALIEIMHKDGFEVRCVSTCQEAISAIKKASPDLLLIDFTMPAKCGLALIRRLRKTSGWEEKPIIVTSARTASHDRDAALEAGADVFLPKPFSRKDFRSTIRQFFPVPATGPLSPAPTPHAA